MTKLDFPDTPSTGQQYGSSGTVWRWDGTRWGSTAGAAGARGVVAYAQITAPQGGIVQTSVNVNGLSVTWTADPSRRYRTSVQYSAWSGVADDDIIVSITDPAGNVKAIKGDTSVSPSVSTGYYVAAVETGLSGSITRKVIARRGAGSGGITIDADPTYPAYIMVEDITYEAGSTPAADPNRPWNSAWGLRAVSNFAVTQGNAGIAGYFPILVSGAFLTPYVAGRRHRITFYYNFSNTVAGDFFQLTIKGGTTSGPALSVANKIFPTINNYMNDTITGLDNTGGYSQYYFGLERVSGTGTMSVVGTNNAFHQMTVEDVGPVTPI